MFTVARAVVCGWSRLPGIGLRKQIDPTPLSIVNHHECRKRFKKGARKGILELLGQGQWLHWVNPDKTYSGIRAVFPPRVLSASSSSCHYAAVECASPHLTPERVKRLCDHIRFLFSAEIPDGHSACARKKAQSSEDMAEVSNLWDVSPPCCAVHAAHSTVAKREKRVIGHIYAIWKTATTIKAQNALQFHLRKLLANVDWCLGTPDPAAMAHNRAVLKETILRLE